MERRTLLQQTAAWAASAFAGTPGRLWSMGSGSQTNEAVNALLERPPILAQFLETKDIVQIGREYLKQSHAERTAKALRSVLLERIGHPTAADLPTLLDRAVRQDYAAHQTTMLTGWVISRTEAHQCALYALGNH